MNSLAHPALAALHVGGGTPGRLIADAGAAGAWIARVLDAPRPRFLDGDALAGLMTPSSPGDLLEDVLARLTDNEGPPEPAMDRVTAMPRDAVAATPAEIAAHARAVVAPPIVSDRRTGPTAPDGARAVRGAPVAVAKPVAKPSSQISAPITKDRPAWVVEATQAAAGTPIRIASLPPASRPVFAPREEDGRTTPPDLPIAPAFGPEPRPKPQLVGRAGKRRTAHIPRVEEAGERIAASESTPATRTMRAMSDEKPFVTATRSASLVPPEVPPDRAPVALPASVPTGARIGGFAGLAALGRSASPTVAALATAQNAQPPSPPQPRAAVPPPAAAPTDARALLDELTETLRLEILAAGIDLSRGRR